MRELNHITCHILCYVSTIYLFSNSISIKVPCCTVDTASCNDWQELLINTLYCRESDVQQVVPGSIPDVTMVTYKQTTQTNKQREYNS